MWCGESQAQKFRRARLPLTKGRGEAMMTALCGAGDPPGSGHCTVSANRDDEMENAVDAAWKATAGGVTAPKGFRVAAVACQPEYPS